MNRRAELPESLTKKSRLPTTRIVYYAEADTSVITTISRGVLFVLALWSGPSVLAFVKITEALSQFDPAGTLDFVVVDTDGIPALYDHPEFIGRMGGWGETAWIKDGKILFTSGLGYKPDCFGPNTQRLLEIA